MLAVSYPKTTKDYQILPSIVSFSYHKVICSQAIRPSYRIKNREYLQSMTISTPHYTISSSTLISTSVSPPLTKETIKSKIMMITFIQCITLGFLKHSISIFIGFILIRVERPPPPYLYVSIGLSSVTKLYILLSPKENQKP